MPTRWLLATWSGGGNVNPLLAVAAGLRRRGHQLYAVAPATLSARLAASGVEVVGEADGWMPTADNVLTALGRCSADALIVDYMLTPALCAAERSELPTAALVHTLFTALALDGAPFPMGMAGPVERINELRAQLGLPAIPRLASLLETADRVLVTAPQELDQPGELGPNVAYAGPVVEEAGHEDCDLPPGEQPLVVVSMGTAGDDADWETALINRIVSALSGLPVRTLVTLPTYIDPSRIDAGPRASVTGYVPHGAVLPGAGVLVNHAGLGSVSAGLAHGVPMVCLPLGREQPHNAAAVARIGAGTALLPEASSEEIAAAVMAELRREARVRLPARTEEAVDLLEALASAR